MKKRLLAAFLSLLMVLSLMPTLALADGSDTYRPYPEAAYELTYEENADGTLIITGYTGTAEGELLLPEQINDKPVTSIGDSAFADCSGFTGSLTIGKNVAAIAADAFNGCGGLNSIKIAVGNTNYSSRDGILYSQDGKEVIRCPEGKTGELTIPAGVTAIGSYVFTPPKVSPT